MKTVRMAVLMVNMHRRQEVPQKTTAACPAGFDGGSCANDMSVTKVSARGSASSKSTGHAGPIAGVLVPMIVAALVYAAVVYRQKRTYSALVKQSNTMLVELVPGGTAQRSGRQQEWRNIMKPVTYYLRRLLPVLVLLWNSGRCGLSATMNVGCKIQFQKHHSASR
jgi:hypothetical protein